MRVIGLTGNIACGKSTVSNILRELGAYIVDADIVAREVVRKGEVAWQMIMDHFGPGYIGEDGELNRKKLGSLVFSDAQALEELNTIVHPIIVHMIDRDIQELRRKDTHRIVVIDAALLIETGCHRTVDEIWLVTIPYEIQLERLMRRDGLTEQQARQRIDCQMPQDEKAEYADVLIDNSKDIEYTKRQIRRLWSGLEEEFI